MALVPAERDLSAPGADTLISEMSSAKSDNQLLGQIEVKSRRSAKTRVYGCLLTPAASAKDDAAEAAHDKIVLVNHGAAGRLYDVLVDRLRQYDALCGDGNAEAHAARPV